MKQTKAQTNYTDHAQKHSERCILCEYFVKPKGCTEVIGRISPEGWCKLFERKEVKDRERRLEGKAL